MQLHGRFALSCQLQRRKEDRWLLAVSSGEDLIRLRGHSRACPGRTAGGSPNPGPGSLSGGHGDAGGGKASSGGRLCHSLVIRHHTQAAVNPGFTVRTVCTKVLIFDARRRVVSTSPPDPTSKSGRTARLMTPSRPGLLPK
uniref:Uncharacterized protein n=1 Tax=Branchiostoma floridae TaxID=7739 RepID=C3ZW99_BRAFL|eukprot:XP_002587161.1 hypothetical protein BRAFLDRAFT_98847 [Branchiostoma floridae]